jgi:hypothetical protein
MWFFRNKKVLFTKDNLARRKRTGCKKCCLCDSEEATEHLFGELSSSHIIYHQTNIKNMFGNWLNGIDKKL